MYQCAELMFAQLTYCFDVFRAVHIVRPKLPKVYDRVASFAQTMDAHFIVCDLQ